MKVSIATTLSHSNGGQFIVHAKTLPGTPYGGHTSPEEADRQSKGDVVTAIAETTLEDLGLDEVGAALAEAGGSLGEH